MSWMSSSCHAWAWLTLPWLRHHQTGHPVQDRQHTTSVVRHQLVRAFAVDKLTADCAESQLHHQLTTDDLVKLPTIAPLGSLRRYVDITTPQMKLHSVVITDLRVHHSDRLQHAVRRSGND